MGKAGQRSRDRKSAYRLGHFAETRAAWALRLKGWRILKRRYRTPAGEIDLIAKRGKVVAFVEVKARSSREMALQSVAPKAQERIGKAARIFISQHPKAGFYTLRFDLIIVTGWRWPEHLADAFRPRLD